MKNKKWNTEDIEKGWKKANILNELMEWVEQ